MGERADGPAVSVLVPVLNEAANIDRTAAAILGQELDEPFEVVFVDGGSDDGTKALLEQLARDDGRVHVLDNPRREVTPALNIGLSAARAPVIARMDAHTLYPRDYLRRGLERLRRRDVAWVSGPQLASGVDAGSRRVALALRTRLGTGGAAFRHGTGDEREDRTGFTGLIERAVLERVGGWDESWPVNEDAELGARVRDAGGRIVIVPELAASYVPRSTLRALARQYARYGVYRERTCRHHPESMELRQALPPALVLTALLAALPLGGPSRAARGALVAYLGLLGLTAARAARGAPPAEAAALPAVFAVMHAAWGAGFLVGAARYGPPVRGMATALRSLAARG